MKDFTLPRCWVTPSGGHMKGKSLRPKVASILSTALITGLLVSIPIPANAAACTPTSLTASNGDTILTFTTVGSCDWTVPAEATQAQVLIVAGGGGGGDSRGYQTGGGGGAGGYFQANSLGISGSITISVGAGGAGGANNNATTSRGTAGGDSSFGTLKVGGGGGGNSWNYTLGAAAMSGTGGDSYLTGGNGGGARSRPNPSAATQNGGTGGAHSSSGILFLGTTLVGTAGAAGANSNSSDYGTGGAGGAIATADRTSSINGNSYEYSKAGPYKWAVGAQTYGSGGDANYLGATDGAGGGAGLQGIVIVRLTIPDGSSAILFNPNKGSGTKDRVIVQNNVAATVPTGSGFTNDGYEFTGWNTAANGSGTAYAAGDQITISTNTTLFAQWLRVPSPSCAAGVGRGGAGTSNFATTTAGNGCVGISYKVNNVTTVTTFNYTGSDQSWTVPTGVTSATFYLIGAGGGGGIQAGGGGGYATGSYAVTAGQILKVIVGQGGGGVASAAVAGLTGRYTPPTYGGGGRGGSFSSSSSNWFSSGGGRSAIRLPGASTDLATAAGGGGGAYGQCGFGGGGTTGLPTTASVNSGTGGTQSGGGIGGKSVNGYPGTNGVAYQGGDSKDDGGGGGGGYFGGGGGGDNYGGGGGSSYIALLTNGSTVAGGDCGAAATATGLVHVVSYDANSATGGATPNNSTVSITGGTLTLASNTGSLVRTNFTFGGWNTAANGSGTTYAVGATTFVPSSDTTLYAQWNSTITYNGNGQTSTTSSVPAATTARGTGAITTLAASGTMARTGFSFAGWNTQADGLGTNYASGLTTYASMGNTTLYARWTATITYNPNGASGSPATSSSNSAPRTSDQIVNSISPIALSSLPTLGTMVRPGFTFGGWNTDATGAGSNFSPNFSLTDPLNPRPYMRFKASDFNDTTNAWTDSSGNNRNIPGTPVTATSGNVRGNPTLVDATGNGASATFKAVKGDGSGLEPDGIVIGNEALDSFTFCHVARYAGSTRDRIFAGLGGNWLSGYWNGQSGVAHPENWITSSAGATDTNWRVMCQTGGPTSGFRSNGVVRTTVTNNTTGLPANITINQQGSLTTPAGQSDWEVAEFVIYSGILNTFQIEAIEDSLKTTYGITGYTAPSPAASAVTFNPTGNTTLFARWLPNAYTLTFDTSTVTSGVMTNRWFSAGTTFTLPANAFVRPGYAFKNWNTAANGLGTTYTNSQSVTLFDNLTLYPQWNLIAPGAPTVTTEAGNTEVTVTPTAAPASGNTVGPTTSMLVTTFNSSGVALNPAKTCAVVSPATSCVITGLTNGTTYQFAATATNATATSASSTKVNGTPTGVVVTYNATTNGGTSGTASATYNKPTALVLPTASKTGFTFSGWYTAATGGTLVGGAGGNYSPNISASIVNRSLTSNVATLTTSAAHGFVVGMSVIVINVNSTFNGTYTITSVPTSTTFTYAKTATNVTAAAVSPAGKATVSALTLYAQFVGNTYTITYNGNGNTGGTVPTSGTFQVGGSSYRVVGGANTPTKTGYTFAGWLSNDLNITRTETLTFSYTGSSQSWTVPTGITSLSFDVRGARGGNSNATTSTETGCSGRGANIGGLGGKVTGTLNVTGGSTLYFYVGGKGADAVGQATSGGFNGGGGVGLHTNASLPVSGSGCFPGAGGGASDIRTSLGTLSSRLVVAGAGGGAGGWDPSNGGAGGGLVGGDGGSVTWGSSTVATGGTQSAGGRKAAVCGGSYGTSAWLGLGGNGTGCTSGGGGGGGGYYGGGGGQHVSGAGGSSYTHPTLVPSFTHTQGSQDGDGVIAITFGRSGLTTVNIDDLITISSNVVFFAQWTANTNTISYNANTGTGSVPSSGSYITGASTPYTVLAKPDGLTKSGSQFIGWNTSADGSGSGYSAGASLTTSSNIVLYAQWGAATYSYSFELNGGTSTQPASGTITHNGQITLPSAPSRAGYTFAGWNDGSTTSNANASINITANKVFVAQWSAQSYSITYEGNGATSGSVTAGSYVAGGVPYAIAANGFTKPGYTFAGWKDAANNSFTVGSGYSTPANLVLTAQWTASSFTVTYNSNGATSGSSSIASETWTYSPTTPLTLSGVGNLMKTGYTFSNWATTANATTGFTTASPTVNTTYYAVWTATQYTVAYAPGTGASGTIASPGNKTFGQTFTLDSGSTLTPPASNGNVSYSFAFWSDGTKTYKSGATYVMPAVNVILTANWIAIYNVTYNPNGGTSSIASVQKTENDQITIEVAATRTGYNFVKWEDQSLGLWNPGDTTTVTAGRFLFNAQWSAKNNTISFNGNSNTGGSVPANGTYVTDGTVYVIPGNSGSLVRTGYTFVGWNTLANGTGTDYPAGVGATYSAPADLALFAKWQANTYLISYNGNGATGGTAPGNDTYVTGAVNPYTVSTNSGTLTKTGFTFDNWYTTSTGSGGTAYTAGSGTLTTTSDLILYAKWSAASYTVSYASGDNAVSAPSQSTNAYGSSFTLPNALTRTGYTFLGWETGSGADANLYAPASSYTMGSSAITFTAKWSPLRYVITYSLNGGSGPTPTQANVDHNQSFTTAAAPTRSGFTFAGWSDGATTTSASTSISNVTANKTLTAQWTIAVPGVPGTPTATPENGGATITITPPASGGTPSSYTVTASPGGATCTVIAPATSCAISPLTNGTPYTFTSTATNTAGTSASSSASTAVTPASAPSEPLGVAGSGTGGSSTITWSAPSDNGGSAITDYIVEYRVATSGTWATFSDGVSGTTSATVTGLSAGSSYEFRVTAKNIIGNSLASFVSPVVETFPAAPSITGVTATSGQVAVTWNAPSHLGSGTLSGDEYIVTAYGSDGNEAGTCRPISGESTCVITGLDNGSAYTFKVRAITTVGESELSPVFGPATPAGVPSAPSDVTAVTSGGNMTISFTAPTDNGGAAITSYVITSNPAGASCTVGANATTYTCTGLTAGTNYTYTVKAVNSKGESSSSMASTGVTAVAAPPSNLNNSVPTGITSIGQTLAAPQVFDGIPFPVITYQWQRCTSPDDLDTCTNIAGATSSSYVITATDVDKYIRVSATATNIISSITVISYLTDQLTGIPQATTPTTGLSGDLNENYTLATAAFGGATPLDYAITSGTLPAGLTLDPLTGNITGTPTVAGTFTITVRATDQKGASSTITFTLTIVDPASPTPTPASTPLNPGAEDAAAAAAAKAAAEKAAADAAAKAAAEKAAADAAAKAAADAAAKLAADRAAADAAAKLAAEKKAAADQAQARATAAAQIAEARATAAAAAQKSAADAAARAAALARSNLVSNAAKRAADLQARNAAAAAATAVRNAANAANAASTANATAAAATKEVVITVGALTSAQSAAEKSAALEAQTAAAKSAAKAAANAAAAQAQIERDRAAAATKAAADALAAAAEKQRSAAEAASRARVEAEVLAKASSERAAAQVNAEKAASEVATLLSEQARVTEQMIAAKDPEAIAQAQAALEVISEKLKTAQDSLSDAVAAVETATTTENTVAANVQKAVARAEATSKSAQKANSEATKRRSEARAVVTQALVSERAAKSAAAAAKKVTVPKVTPPPSAPVSAGKSDATISVGGLKPGQKIRVIVKVNVKVNVK